MFLTGGHTVLRPIRDVVEEGNGKRMCPLKEKKGNNEKELLKWKVKQNSSVN